MPPPQQIAAVLPSIVRVDQVQAPVLDRDASSVPIGDVVAGDGHPLQRDIGAAGAHAAAVRRRASVRDGEVAQGERRAGLHVEEPVAPSTVEDRHALPRADDRDRGRHVDVAGRTRVLTGPRDAQHVPACWHHDRVGTGVGVGREERGPQRARRRPAAVARVRGRGHREGRGAAGRWGDQGGEQQRQHRAPGDDGEPTPRRGRPHPRAASIDRRSHGDAVGVVAAGTSARWVRDSDDAFQKLEGIALPWMT